MSERKSRFLKLSPGYFILWAVLVLVILSKIYLIQGIAPAALSQLALFGAAMLAISYLGAWTVWRFSARDQRTGEIAYLAIMTVIFLVRTVQLYREAMAAM